MPKNITAVTMIFCASALACAVQAQTGMSAYPARTVHLIVPFAPGAFTDGSARLLAKELSEQTGQPFVVDNKVGAAGTIGTDFVAKAAPDGYTLLITETSFAMAPALYPKLPYDAARDLLPVSQYADATAVLMMRNGLGVSSVKDLVAMARANPGKLSFGSAGTGSSSHLPIEWFSSLADLKMLHVPFKGAAASIPELIAGRVARRFPMCRHLPRRATPSTG